jgi:hypothetical protein
LAKKFIQGQKSPKRPMKAKKAIKGQNFKKSLILSIFNAKPSINANVLLENVDFYVKEKIQFYTMIMHILEKRPKH